MDITGFGSAFEFARGIMDRFWPKQASEAEKLQVASELAPMIDARDNQVIEAKRDVIVSEMNQDDAYTKRARPTLIYAGLFFILMVHVVLPFVIKCVMLLMYLKMDAVTIKALESSPKAIEALRGLTDLSLPTEFWVAWGGAVSVWSIGRSAEKRGVAGKIVSLITGGSKPKG